MEPLMIFFSKVLIVWLSLDLAVIATGWFAVATIRPRWPQWWRRVVADELPVVRAQLSVVSGQLPSASAMDNPQAQQATDILWR